MPKFELNAISFCAVFVSAMVFSSPIWAQEFLPYEGKNTVREGDGGTKKVVDGIEFWSDGAPPRPFKLLGYITDRRHKTGLLGMVRMASLESSIAEVAKSNGGDAVILVSSEAETVGVINNSSTSIDGTARTTGNTTSYNANANTSGFGTAVQKQQSKFAVVRYVNAEKRNPDQEPPRQPDSSNKPMQGETKN